MVQYPVKRLGISPRPSFTMSSEADSYQWVPVQSTPQSGRTFARPLGVTEHNFYLDRLFNSTADIVWHYTVEADPAQGAVLFSEGNVSRAWATVKQYYPLLGARMVPNDRDVVEFIVTERALSHHQPEEVTVRPVSSRGEVDAVRWRNIRDNPTEDSHILARVFAFTRVDEPGTYEVLLKAAHAIADGVSGATLARTFFDVLSSPAVQVPPLEERLAMTLPSEALDPTLKRTPACRRWRRAVGRIILHNMRRKLAGGHAMVRTATEASYRTPSVTSHAFVQLTPSESRKALDSCRRHKVTFGSVIAVLSQMALTRLLHRRYLRGELSEDEWEYRRRQPMHYGGPINLRPYLDQEWQRKGGVGELGVMIDYYDCTLPFMPTPYGARRDTGVPRVNGAPPYSALLSRERFFHRAQLARQQVSRLAKHPLFLEIVRARQPLYHYRRKVMVTHWQAAARGEPLPQYPELAKIDTASPDYCFTGALSSIGDLSFVLPSNYPLPSSHPLSIKVRHATDPMFGAVGEASATRLPSVRPPTTAASDTVLRIVNSATYLHSRPLEFFLGNSTSSRNTIDLMLTYDANAYRTEDAEEYLQECREAALYYLGASDSPAKGKL
ncbi:hypothetical protein BD413DRAFT_501199 [Trametes elegans]|nr:hypothetical protein BD413DRAFT_501199 [Trametes elegans]